VHRGDPLSPPPPAGMSGQGWLQKPHIIKYPQSPTSSFGLILQVRVIRKISIRGIWSPHIFINVDHADGGLPHADRVGGYMITQFAHKLAVVAHTARTSQPHESGIGAHFGMMCRRRGAACGSMPGPFQRATLSLASCPGCRCSCGQTALKLSFSFRRLLSARPPIRPLLHIMPLDYGRDLGPEPKRILLQV
jgi:hypothetical protein